MGGSPAERGCSVTLGLASIALGVLLLVSRYVDLGFWDFFVVVPWELAWPLFIVVPGGVMLLFGLLGRGETAGLAIPGSIVTTVGLILWFQALTGTWETWSYAWALIPAALGIGMIVLAVRTDNPSLRTVGQVFAAASLIGFVGLAFLFEVVIGIGGLFDAQGRRVVLAVLVIIGGLFLVFIPRRRTPVATPPPPVEAPQEEPPGTPTSE